MMLADFPEMLLRFPPAIEPNDPPEAIVLTPPAPMSD
jgi:hypothetical protein